MDVTPDAPVLLFDSGFGGLTVLTQLRAILPDAPILYAADLAGLPYGEKSEAEIAARVSGLLGRMAERYRPRLICIACNTASTIALGMVRDVLETPVVGTVPAIKPAAEQSRSGVIGLLGTNATIRQRYVDELERDFAGNARLVRHGAPALVHLAEAKLRGEATDLDKIAVATRELRKAGGDSMDTVVLACTHFPLLSRELAEVFGPQVTLLDGATGIARQVARVTRGQPFQRSAADRAIVTGNLPSLPLSVLRPWGLEGIERF